MQITPSLSSPKLIIPFIHCLPSATSLIPPKIQAKCQGDPDKTIHSSIFKLFISTLISLLSWFTTLTHPYSCLFSNQENTTRALKHSNTGPLPRFRTRKRDEGSENYSRGRVFSRFSCNVHVWTCNTPCLVWWAVERIKGFGSFDGR